MSKLIVYCHPYDKSFNHAILEKIKEQEDIIGVIDLYKDKFSPIYTTEELEIYSAGKTLDDNVKKYQQLLLSADELIIITPIWWNNIPGMLKGFFDKVMKVHFAYENTKMGVKGLLTNIERAYVVTTSNSPTWYIKLAAGNVINGSLKATLKQIGVKKITWKNLGNIKSSSKVQRGKFLDELKKI